LATDVPSLIFRSATPNTAVLVGLDCKLETLGFYGALTAHFFCRADLLKRLACAANWKEQFWIGIATERIFTPGVVGGSKGKACCEDRQGDHLWRSV
jgi:hypothetical protein